MEALICDSETTTHNKGHWADQRNRLVMLGFQYVNTGKPIIYTEFNRSVINEIQEMINTCDVLVGFAFKFDLHWLANIGVDLRCIKRVWDIQIGEFLLAAQRNPYNSLNDACMKYNIPLKLDVVKTEYWDKGIDTDAIPTAVLQEYLEADLDRTERVFKIQHELFTGVKL